MALRRPLLLVCVLTIVLGINYEVRLPTFPVDEDAYFKTSFTPLNPVPDGKPSSPAKLMAKLTDKESRPPFREVEDADLCSPFRVIVFPGRSVQNLKRTKEKAKSPDTGLKTMDVDREWMGLVENMWITIEKYPGPDDATHDLNFDMSRSTEDGAIVELYIEKDSQRRELERTNKMEGIFALWNKMHGTRGTTLSDVHASNQGALALPPNAASVTNWTDEKCSVDFLSASLSSHNQSIIQQSPPTLSKQQTVVINTGLYGSDFQNYTEVYETDALLEKHFYLWHSRSAQDLENHDQCQVYPGAATEINSSELSLGGYLFDFAINRKEFQPNGTDFRCSIEQDEQYVDALLLSMCLYSFFHQKISKDEDMTAAMQQQVKLLSLCIMLARTLLCKEDWRRRLLQPLHMTTMTGNSIHDIIKTAVRNILTREGLPNLQFNCTANGKPFEHILPKSLEDETPSLPVKDRRFGHLSSYLGMQDEPEVQKIKPKNMTGQDKSTAYTGFDLEKDTHRDSKWNGLSQYLTSFIPRRQVVYTVFPASFLPNPGASVKDRMSHVLNRLASLNSLPASCDISRVRLAEAGFYYDNSKTVRDASNVHEVVCYSCGLTYGQWKKGDNPTTIHVHIKPECEYVRNKNVSNSTPLASSSNASSHISEDRSSLASSRVSMSNDNVSLLSTSASTLSSGHSSLTTESMQQTSMPYNSLSLADSGLGTGSFSSGASGSVSSHHQTPFENRSAATRSDGGDLATDCSAIAPQPRSSNQSTFSGLARDSAVSSQLSYQSSYSTSRDTSRARALDLDDRPPLDMTSAVYPQFCRHQERRATFSTWPLSDLFRPDDLVMQGFYYAGYADCLRCFYCGVGLKSWAEDDDVMVEHIRWRPSCGYVLNTKGRQYVDRILNSLGQANSNGEQSNRDSTNRASQSADSLQSTTPSTNPSTTTTQPSTTSTTATAASATVQTTSSASTTPSATTPSASATASQASAAASNSSTSSGGNAGREVLRKVEDMGFSKESIARAVRHFQQAGKTKISADALVEKILELESDDAGNNATGGNPTDRDGLQTDGPEGASNYGVDADIQRAQRILTENERLKARQKCKICKEAKVGMIFLPCGHILACTQCGSKTKNCTHCGEFIRATANVYLS